VARVTEQTAPKTAKHTDVTGRWVLVRADRNVAWEDGKLTDETRSWIRQKEQTQMDHALIRELVRGAETKIILLVIDGLGGVPREPGGLTELETARTPNLDRLAARGVCGLQQAAGVGITVGSGPGHLALFGYDPLRYRIGRGVLAALGTDFELRPSDVAARGNFCTVDSEGRVTDRRAGRISTDTNKELCALLRDIELPEVELFVETVKEHRLLVVLRGAGLSGEIADTDPRAVGEPPRPPKPRSPEAERTAGLVRSFLEQAQQRLRGREPANMVILRGFGKLPAWPSFWELYGLRAAAVAEYPMYRGVAELVGMEALDVGPSVEDRLGVTAAHWHDFDFFFVHVKTIDSAGEDGDFARKVAEIERVDAAVPRLLELGPDVIVVTGDHSTPAVLKSHSWHPVPVILWSRHCRRDTVERFGERACEAGALGARLPAVDLMPLILANALRLDKYGA
jgi:2,3-bisphosphoglycerate-independent phosphoglycerate mutase